MPYIHYPRLRGSYDDAVGQQAERRLQLAHARFGTGIEQRAEAKRKEEGRIDYSKYYSVPEDDDTTEVLED